MYQPAPTPDQTGLGPEEVKYYPFRLYWEWKECMTMPLSTNPVWKNLFPDAPEHATAWMDIYPDGSCAACAGACIH